jgi:hypothetical protein
MWTRWGVAEIGTGIEHHTADHTFKADGTFTNTNGDTGRWLQVEELAVWRFTSPAESVGLAYSAIIQPGQTLPTEDSMKGIMWYVQGGNLGTFRAQRQLVGDEILIIRGGVLENNTNPALGPVADPLLADSNDPAAQDSS